MKKTMISVLFMALLMVSMVIADSTPSYINLFNNASNAITGDVVKFSVSFIDDIALNHYSFADNDSGSWTNVSSQDINPYIMFHGVALGSPQMAYAKQGEIIAMNKEARIIKIEKDSACTATTAYIHTKSNGALAAQTTFGGNLANVNVVLLENESYYIVVDSEGFGFDMTLAGTSSYPYVDAPANWTGYSWYGSGWHDGLDYVVCITNVSFASIQADIEEQITVTASSNSKICGIFYFNDSVGNQNVTDESCFQSVLAPDYNAWIEISEIYWNPNNVIAGDIAYCNFTAITGNDTLALTVYYALFLNGEILGSDGAGVFNNTPAWFAWNTTGATEGDVYNCTAYANNNLNISSTKWATLIINAPPSVTPVTTFSVLPLMLSASGALAALFDIVLAYAPSVIIVGGIILFLYGFATMIISLVHKLPEFFKPKK